MKRKDDGGTALRRLYLTQLDYPGGECSEDVVVGAWCLSRDELLDPSTISVQLLPYTCGGKEFFRKANREVARAYDRLLPHLVQSLNNIHGIDRSVRFWQAVGGYWFRQYLDNLFERYQVLNAASDVVGNAWVGLIPIDKEWVALDTDSYSVALFSDRLNHQLYGQIIRARKLYQIKEMPELAEQDEERLGRRSSSAKLKQIVSWFSCVSGRFNQVVLLRTYFSWKLLARLALRFRSIPLIGTPKLKDKAWCVDRQRRKKLAQIVPENATDFELLAIELMPFNLPGIFLERFSELLHLAERLRPRCSKVFLTANAFAAHEVYKVWVGLAMEEGTGQHIILQHGANYGHSDVMSEEEFEVSSCDAYLTTGWKQDSNKRIRPFVASSFLGGIGDFRRNKPTHNSKGDILWVLASLPRYHYTQWSAAQGPNFQQYLRDQSVFLNALGDTSRQRILCRGYHYDYGWGDLDYIEQLSTPFRVDRERKPLRQGIEKASLVVFTYDSTSMMESMAMNVPTLCFWDHEHWGWRDEAMPLLKELAEVGIFHERPELVAEFINRLMSDSDVIQWWASPKIQQARAKYCAQYANTLDNEYLLWTREIGTWLSGS